MEIFDFLNDINYRKTSIMKEDPDCERFYEPYRINKFLSQNFWNHCDKKLQYEYFINSLRERKRRAHKWLEPESFYDIECIKEYFNYSTRKAKDAFRILSHDDLEYIKDRLYKGGLKK